MSLTNRTRVLVLFGGRSAEHEISILSARFVIASLDPERYEVLPVGIGRDGNWSMQDAHAILQGPSDPRRVSLGPTDRSVRIPAHPPSDGQPRVEVAGADPISFDVVFPVLHGPLGEDGALQGLLELAGVPYVGSGVLGSAVGMDKDAMKRLLLQAGLPVLPYRAVRRAEWAHAPELALSRLDELAVPIFVKPACLGSSVGVSRVLRRRDLSAAIHDAFQFDDKVVIESGLDRPREIECAILGGDLPRVSVPGEITIDQAAGFYSYQVKYIDGALATLSIPARLSTDQKATAQRLALDTFRALDAEGLARVDLFLSRQGQFYVNEINTLPGFTEVSMFPRLWAETNLSSIALMDALVEDAIERSVRRRARRATP